MRSMLPSTPAAADSHCTSNEVQAEEAALTLVRVLYQKTMEVLLSQFMHRICGSRETVKCSN